mgnify:CR=1 FL=1
MFGVFGLDLDLDTPWLARKKGTLLAARSAAVNVLEKEGDKMNPCAADTRRAGVANLKARRMFI